MFPIILNSQTWTPIASRPLLEGYLSFVWTERFREAGEFQFTTPHVDDILSRLQLGSLLTLRDSVDMMMVENMEIQETDKGPILTVSGRSIMAFLDYRTAMDNSVITKDDYGYAITSRPYVEDTEYPIKMLPLLVTKGIGQLNDILSAWPPAAAGQYQMDPVQYNPKQTQDKLTQKVSVWGGYLFDPILTRSPDVGSGAEQGPNTWLTHYDFKSQPSIYAHLVEGLKARNRGLLFYRPGVGGAFDDGAGGRDYSYAWYHLKDPSDHTITAVDEYDRVVFDIRQGHLINPSYLWSTKDYRNIAYVYSKAGFKVVAPYGQSTAVSGLNRRVLQVDATELDDPSTDWFYQGYPDLDSALTHYGRKALNKHNKLVIFDAKVSDTAPYDFGYPIWYNASPSYAMGDYVTVVGDYDVSQTMQVTEFVRTEDAFGNESKYPGLVTAEKLL